MRLDDATKAFMSKVSEDTPHESHAVRDALSAAKKLVRVGHNPSEILPRMMIGAATKELLKEGTMPPLKIFGVLNDHYGRDWWDWEPETIWTTLEREQGIHTDDELKNIIMAFQVIVNTNAPFEHWHVFEKVGHALNQNPVEFQVIQPLELDEIALTMRVLRTMRPAQGFEDDICGYTAAAAKSAGLTYLPPDLFAERCQDVLDSLNNNREVAGTVQNLWTRHMGKIGAQSEQIKHQLDMLLEIKDYAEKH